MTSTLEWWRRKDWETMGEMEWLVKDISGELKAWGHLGGEGHRLILKSDGESEE